MTYKLHDSEVREVREVRAGDGTLLPPSPMSVSELRLLTVPQPGTDRLSFATWDTIEVLGQGEETIEFRGHYVIERTLPTSADWSAASIKIAMRELNVTGVSQKFGRIQASVNPDAGPSGGQVKEGTVYPFADSPKMCQMDGHMKFELLDLGITVFNKEPIRLEHKITHIPPVGQGGGTSDGAQYELFLKNEPDAPPVAILKRVKTHIGGWLE